MCVCAGRGIPTGQSPERSLRAAPGVFSLSSLFLEENFLLTRPPTSTHTHAGFPHTLRGDQVSPLSPGQLPGQDADLPRIIKRLHNHQNPNSICYSVASRQTQQQCHGTDTKAPRSLPGPQISREPRRTPCLCRARSADPGPSSGVTGALPGSRVITRVHPGEERAINPRRKKLIYLKPRRCKGWKSCPPESSASYNRGWKAIFKNRRRE